MDDFLFISKLSECQLLLRHTNEALRTQVAKASYFLDHVIKPALDIDDTSSFDNLLSVMEHSDYTNVKILASIIKSEFDKEADIKPGVYEVLEYLYNLYFYIHSYVAYIIKYDTAQRQSVNVLSLLVCYSFTC